MAKIIAIANQKGGVAKTTTACALVACLHARGLRVLLIDTDPQANASDTLGAVTDDVPTICDILWCNEPISGAIQNRPVCDILPSEPALRYAEEKLTGMGRYYVLQRALAQVEKDYDYIIIDTPPTIGVMQQNALIAAADGVIVPITTDRYALAGLAQLRDTMNEIRQYGRPDLRVRGLLLCKCSSRMRIERAVEDMLPDVASMLDTKIYDTRIRESVAAREAQAARTSLYSFASLCTTAVDYKALMMEILKEDGNA